MSNGQALTNLIIILVVFYFAAFFVAAEFAIVSVRKSALESALEAAEARTQHGVEYERVSFYNAGWCHDNWDYFGVARRRYAGYAVDRSAWLHAVEQDEHRGNQCRFGRRYFDVP